MTQTPPPSKQPSQVDNATASPAAPRNRLILLSLLVIFAFPFLLAIYFIQHPDSSLLKHSQHGQLIQPVKAIQDFLNEDKLARKWRVAVITDQPCAQECEGLLNATQRLVKSLGEDQSRFERWLISPSSTTWGDTQETFTAFVKSTTDIAAFLKSISPGSSPSPATTMTSSRSSPSLKVLLIDPKGRALMTFPSDANFKHIRKDCRRLLKASRIG